MSLGSTHSRSVKFKSILNLWPLIFSCFPELFISSTLNYILTLTFQEFLKKEFADENIMFWKECEKYRKITDLNERKAKATEIFERHLSATAGDPVNVDSQARQMTQAGVDDAAPDLFKSPQTQVRSEMCLRMG